MTCDNTATNLQLNQVLGSPSQQLGVSGPAKALTIPLFGGSSTCVVQLYRNGQPCNLTTNPCADGSVQFTLSSSGAGAISCGIVQSVSGQNLTVPSGTTATNCVQQAQFTQVNAGCGQSIVNGTQNATASGTCVAVVIDAQSMLGACINSPTAGFCTPPSGSNFAGATITMTVQFVATPASGGSAGGTQLGTNTFTVAAPEPGLLLVSASPQLIPSNGTAASVVSATFACGSGASSINGFPLSGAGATVPGTFTTGSTTIVNQPIIGTGQNAGCGAGLPGTFQFTTPGGILFDNGTRSETVLCGVSGQLSPFGNGGSPPFGQGGPVPNALAPLVFTCTGAAVLAMGQVAGQEVPVNVVYTAAGSGFTAVGSTAITVAPSQPPRISVSCRPNTIAAGNPGSVCTSQVRDANGQPLNGVTGANVTWTTSDPSGTSILPCTVSVPGSISVATAPLIAPQVSASTPCQTATAQVNGVNTSTLFGLATAVLVTSPTVRPETVTVTATLVTQIPPSFACFGVAVPAEWIPLRCNRRATGQRLRLRQSGRIYGSGDGPEPRIGEPRRGCRGVTTGGVCIDYRECRASSRAHNYRSRNVSTCQPVLGSGCHSSTRHGVRIPCVARTCSGSTGTCRDSSGASCAAVHPPARNPARGVAQPGRWLHRHPNRLRHGRAEQPR
jgi:hypothetical protein